MSQDDNNKPGCLNAPERHAIDWQSEDYYDHDSLYQELARVYDICHGCRRCVNLCHTFPTLFDLIDESETLEVDGVQKEDFFKPVEHCYLCDRCYMVKCPYVPPHEWNVDFPHLMLRAKAYQFKNEGTTKSNQFLTATDKVGKIASIPVVAQTTNALNKNKTLRKVLAKTLNVHPDVTLPKYHAKTAKKRVQAIQGRHKVVLFISCFCNYNRPDILEDLVAVLKHNQCEIAFVKNEKCCGMPKLELGDFETVQKLMQHNIELLLPYVDKGYSILSPMPSCVLMFKQELPLMFIKNKALRKVRDAFRDPFEFLLRLDKKNLLNLNFETGLGEVYYHQPCHSQVQNIGTKVRDVLKLIPDTQITITQRCSGHDGTYGVKVPYFDISMKISKPIAREIEQKKPAIYTSDCPMAGQHIADNLQDTALPVHPISLLRRAYGV